jgi:hypothetical protein
LLRPRDAAAGFGPPFFIHSNKTPADGGSGAILHSDIAALRHKQLRCFPIWAKAVGNIAETPPNQVAVAVPHAAFCPKVVSVIVNSRQYLGFLGGRIVTKLPAGSRREANHA